LERLERSQLKKLLIIQDRISRYGYKPDELEVLEMLAMAIHAIKSIKQRNDLYMENIRLAGLRNNARDRLLAVTLFEPSENVANDVLKALGYNRKGDERK